jgi:hypothetical protein
VSKMQLSFFNLILIRPRQAIGICHRRIISASWADTGRPHKCHSRKDYLEQVLTLLISFPTAGKRVGFYLKQN